jgi:thymidylate synthase ThyX
MRIYSLEHISAEQRAATYAKASRASSPYGEIAKEVAQKQAEEFLEHWVVKEGHTSIAEHIPLSFVLEDVPYIAATWLESYQKVATLSRSSRHQKVEKEYFAVYTDAMEMLFRAYEHMLSTLEGKVFKVRAYEISRGLLPIGTLTSLALSTNAAVLLKILGDGAAHPLKLVREICEKMRKTARQAAPSIFSNPVPPLSAPSACLPARQGIDLFVDFPTLRDILHWRKGVVTFFPWTVEYGYEAPPELQQYGLAKMYAETLEKAKETVKIIASQQKDAAQFLIPFAFQQRLLLSLSLEDMMEIQATMEPENESKEFLAVWNKIAAKFQAI